MGDIHLPGGDFWFDISLSPLRDASGEISAVVAFLLDITERKRVEEALRENTQMLSVIYKSVGDVLYYIGVEPDDSFRFLSINPAFMDATGLREEEIIGKRIEEIIPEPSVWTVLDQYKKAIKEKNIVRWVETSAYPAGEKTGEVTIAPILDTSGVCTHLVGSVHDITENKRLEAQFLQAQKMKAVGTLAGGVAHDFNNLLTVIGGNTQLALMNLLPEDPLQNELKQIQKAANRAASLTNQLLAFSRKQTIEPKILDLNTIVEDIEKMLLRLIGEDIELIIELAPNLYKVKVDSGQIDQVLVNLMVNARDAMPNGGKIVLETQNIEVDEEFVKIHHGINPGSYVVLSFSDTGCGMTEEMTSQIF